MNMSMKKNVLAVLMMALLPFLAMAQSNDDLYFVPKKKEKKVTSGTSAKVVVEKEKTPVGVFEAPGTTVVVKDVKGNVRDVDEYNRRYTSRDNTFTMENDTLYIEEKPYSDRGEWINGFEGSQADYEYAMRIVRFRNPRYAIPVSSPLYWDVIYALPSWEWNVYDDGFYAYAFPTYSNSLWWDWRYNYSWGWGWRPSWYYNSWYAPGYWYAGHWGHPHWHHHHHYPYFAWGGVGGYWGGGHGWNGSSAHRPGIHAGRYEHNYRTGVASSSTGRDNRRVTASGNRNSRDSYVGGTRQRGTRSEGSARQSSGRVVTAKDGSSSVRPQRSAMRSGRGESTGNRESSGTRSNTVYTRPAQGKGSSYNRESSTRSTVNNSGSSYQRRGSTAERGSYRSNSSSGSSSSRSSYSSGSSSSRSSYSSGSSSSSRSSAGGGSSRSGGGNSRSGGGRR
jgi:hypothetical protein